MAAEKFGQVVIGPPGCGKTSYCGAVASQLHIMGRKVALVNLDPANDSLPYEAQVNVIDLVKIKEVTENQQLGPNGALVHAMEMLLSNTDWLLDLLKKYPDYYFIFDFPGQAELYAHHSIVKDLLNVLSTAGFRLCSVYLVDAHYANEPGKFLSALIVALMSMLQLECPAINVLSKIDLLDRYESLPMPLEFYTEVLQLDYLLEQLDDTPLTRRYLKLNKMIAELVTDYSLVSFIPVSIANKQTLLRVLQAVDKANGYVYGSNEERNIQRLLSCAVGAEFDHDRFGVVKEVYEGAAGQSDDDYSEEDKLLHAYATQNPNVL